MARAATRCEEQRGGKERLHALRQLAGAAKTDELPAVSLDLLGVALFVDGDAEGAADVPRKAQRSHPRDAWLKYNLARCLEKLGRKEEAIRYLMAARTIRPESAHGLAHLLEQKGESDEAAAIFQDLVRLRPDQANHWACYGHLLTDLGERNTGRECQCKSHSDLAQDHRAIPATTEPITPWATSCCARESPTRRSPNGSR